MKSLHILLIVLNVEVCLWSGEIAQGADEGLTAGSSPSQGDKLLLAGLHFLGSVKRNLQRYSHTALFLVLLQSLETCLAQGLDDPAPSFVLEPKHILVYHKFQEDFRCIASNALQLSLICNGEELSHVPQQKDGQSLTRSLQFHFDQSHVEKGPLCCHCRAVGSLGIRALSSKKVSVQLAYLSRNVTLSTDHVREGDTLRIQCLGKGYPAPRMYLYRRVGLQWENVSHHTNQTQPGSIVMEKEAQLNDTGIYICAASNLAGTGFSPQRTVFIYKKLFAFCSYNPVVIPSNSTDELLDWQRPWTWPLKPPEYQKITTEFNPPTLTPPWSEKNGSILPLVEKYGRILVTYTATDNFGQRDKCTFTMESEEASGWHDKLLNKHNETPSAGRQRNYAMLVAVVSSGAIVYVVIGLVLVRRRYRMMTDKRELSLKKHCIVGSEASLGLVVELQKEVERMNLQLEPVRPCPYLLLSSWDNKMFKELHNFRWSHSSNSVTRKKGYATIIEGHYPIHDLQPQHQDNFDTNTRYSSLPVPLNRDSTLFPDPFMDIDFEEIIPKKADPNHFVFGQIDSSGGCLTLEGLDISLIIPAGAIPDNERKLVYLSVLKKEYQGDYPTLGQGETHLGQTVICGPNNTKFQKPVILVIQHSARNINDWNVTLKCSEADHNSDPEWKNVYSSKDPGKFTDSMYCILEEKYCRILTVHFSMYCPCGEPLGDGDASQEYKIIPFSSFRSSRAFVLRVFCAKITDSIQVLKEQEASRGFSQNVTEKSILIEQRECENCPQARDVNLELDFSPENLRIFDSPSSAKKVIQFQQLLLSTPPYQDFTLLSEAPVEMVTWKLRVCQTVRPENYVEFENVEWPLLMTQSPTINGPLLYSLGRSRPSSCSSVSSCFALPSDIRHRLCIELEIYKALGSGWEKLANELELKNNYMLFTMSQNQELKSSLVLDVFESKYTVSESAQAMEDLKRILGSIEEDSCVRILEEEMDNEVFLPRRLPVEHDNDDDSGLDVSVASV